MTIEVNDLRQWQHDSRVQSNVRRLAGDAADEIDRLRRRVTVLEMVIRQDLEPEDCSDDLNRMIVDGIRQMYSVKIGDQQSGTQETK